MELAALYAGLGGTAAATTLCEADKAVLKGVLLPAIRQFLLPPQQVASYLLSSISSSLLSLLLILLSIYLTIYLLSIFLPCVLCIVRGRRDGGAAGIAGAAVQDLREMLDLQETFPAVYL